MTVRDSYQLNELLLEKMADSGSTYWINVMNFYEQVCDRDADSLTKGQLGWLTKISDDLESLEEKHELS